MTPDHRPRRPRAPPAVFADGAGAVVLRGAEQGRIGPIVLGADGANADLIRDPARARRDRDAGPRDLPPRGRPDVRGDAARRSPPPASRSSEVDLFVYHQANARILRSVGERLDLPAERVVDSIHHFGNTSAASIPLALEDARLAGRLEPGATVLLAAFGAGLTWGATVVEWGRS